MLTPAFNHLLCFDLVRCAKKVSKLINRPVVSLLDTRMGGTSAEVVPDRINLKLPTTAIRQRQLLQVRYISNDTRGKKYPSVTIRPGFMSVMRPDLPQPTHGFQV